MLSNKFGIAGAAMLGTVALLGTNAAYAQITINDDDEVMGITYAQETLLKQTEDELEGYHTLVEAGGDGTHNVTLGGVSYGDGDNFNLTVTLINMKFAEVVPTAADAVDLGGTDDTGHRKHKGVVGDNSVLLAFSSNAIGENQDLVIDLPDLAISGGSGSIMLRLVNASTEEAFGEGTGTTEKTYTGAIKVVKALDPMFKAGPVVTAAVADSFRLFSAGAEEAEGREHASLGTLELDVKAAMKADGSGEATVNDLIKVAANTGDGATRNDASSSISFSGDLSFAQALWLEEQDATDTDANGANGRADDCSVAPTARNLLKLDDDGNVEDESKIVNIAELHGGGTDEGNVQKLCMWVYPKDDDKSMAINAGSYYVTPNYKATADTQAMTPQGEMSLIGSIQRDGTTVRLPYLTTSELYNQRLVVVNRGTGDAKYEMTFTEEVGVTATSMLADDAMLLGSSTSVMKMTDLVMIDGGTRTAGTLIIESNPTMISVATTTVNLETRGTDTLTYMAE